MSKRGRATGTVVSGAIAVDRLAQRRSSVPLAARCDGPFEVCVSAPRFSVSYGGCGANIAIGLARLGLHVALVSVIGERDVAFKNTLRANGVDVAGVSVANETAEYIAVSDPEGNVVSIYSAGACSEPPPMTLRIRPDDTYVAIVSPSSPRMMVGHASALARRGVPYIADVGQQVTEFTSDDLVRFLADATWLIFNEGERRVMSDLLGEVALRNLLREKSWIETRAAEGCVVKESREQPSSFPAPRVVDPNPTGAGDAFRAGFIAGLSHGLETADAVRLAMCVAALCLRSVGAQDYPVTQAEVTSIARATYGGQLADRLRSIVVS